MDKATNFFVDRDGGIHRSAESAAQFDIAKLVLGSRPGSVPSSIAKLIVEKRAEIETVFAELDQAQMNAAAEVIRLGKAKVARHG